MLQVFCRSPNKPVTDFTQFITAAMEHTNQFRTVFAVDFYIDFMNNSNVTRKYIITFRQYSLVNEIKLSTYIWPSNGSATSSINQVWHNLNVPRTSYIVFHALPDYYAACVILRVKHDNPPKTIRFRDFSDVNAERFAENIEAEFSLCCPPVSNPNEYADYMVNIMKKSL